MDLKMEELHVGERSRLSGHTLIDTGIRQEMNVIIVAIRKKMEKWPLTLPHKHASIPVIR